MKDSLSIVMPAYNESAVIVGFLEELDTEILQKFDEAEIIVVDDRSTDGTPALLDEVADRMPRLKVEHSPVNQGHGPTLRRAIDLSNNDWIFHVDSDRQFVASEFWDLWDLRDRADLILGVRASRQDPKHRLLLTKIVRAATAVLAGRAIADPNIPFKIFSRDLWRDVGPLIKTDALAPSIMIAMAASLRGHQVSQVPVTHLPREHGQSSLRLWRLVRFSLHGLYEIVRFKISLRT